MATPETPEQSDDAVSAKEATMKTSIKDTAKKLWGYVSVEPMFVFFLIPSFIYYTAFENLPLEKVCQPVLCVL